MSLGVLTALLVADVLVATALIIATLAGTAGGHLFQRPLGGAIVGALFPMLYVLSVEVVADVGHRAGWPTGNATTMGVESVALVQLFNGLGWPLEGILGVGDFLQHPA